MDARSARLKFNCKSSWLMMVSAGPEGPSLISSSGDSMMRSIAQGARLKRAGTWAAGKLGASRILQDNSDTVNRLCFASNSFRAHISARVKDAGLGQQVSCPEEHAPRNSKDLAQVSDTQSQQQRRFTVGPRSAHPVPNHQHSNCTTNCLALYVWVFLYPVNWPIKNLKNICLGMLKCLLLTTPNNFIPQFIFIIWCFSNPGLC